ncbi:hypothetical protein KDA23_07910 [Candidatus Saccharibacteria bacterium]|nr:hypothetical protein [Candidatus Saccharibacteria bacterium]
MAQNYASEDLAVIDERFYTESKTSMIINNGLTMTFEGVNTVTIYNVDVVAEVDYVRDGENRFGPLVELGTGVQSFVLSQDKAFTFTVDRGNLEDSKMVQEADKAVKRQVREVSIPTTDIYRLSVLASYAVANTQGTLASALSASNVFQGILTERAALIDAEVPVENLAVYITATTETYLWRDPEFKYACDKSYADNKTGVIGRVLGMDIVVCPSSYYIANFGFMIVAKNVLVAPTKFNMVRILDGVQGIDGKVAEGRRYYDAFIPTNKGVAIRIRTIA